MAAKRKKVLVVDIGGSQLKILASGQSEVRTASSGHHMDARQMVRVVRGLTGDWKYDAVSVGYPGKVLNGKVIEEPANLKHGWVRFDYAEAFGRPVRIMNDAAMQALGSYEKGRMLYLGLGTGLGSTLIVDGKIIPLSLGDLPFRAGGNFGHYLSKDALHRLGHRRWEDAVHAAIKLLRDAFEADHVTIGGGHAERLGVLPHGARRGNNDDAFEGGFRMWRGRPC